jgi:hypothetical protein
LICVSISADISENPGKKFCENLFGFFLFVLAAFFILATAEMAGAYKKKYSKEYKTIR